MWLVRHMEQTKFINTIREIWWDVRPHHSFGTVEVRVCDMPGNLDDCLALGGLIQCLVKALSDIIDEGAYQHDCHPMLVQQNKWRACRYGTKAKLVNVKTFETQSVHSIVNSLIDYLQPVAKELNCQPYLERIREMASRPSWADRQLEIFRETDDPRQVVEQMVRQSRIL